MANTGILQRRQQKNYFYTDDTKPVIGEIVYAIDTDEFGSLNPNTNDIEWIPRKGLVTSVANKIGNVELDKNDVGLDQVDNTSDFDKPISNATLNLHLEHVTDYKNPHKTSKHQVGLGNVDNTSDLNKPVSTLTQVELDKKVDNSRVLTDVPENAVFTDTTYKIKDGELSEFNFTFSRKEKLDNLEKSNIVLGTQGLSVDGRTIKLTRGDGSFETIETQDTIYNDRFVLEQIENLSQTKLDKSSVPPDPKYTDTIYDDSEIKNKLRDLEQQDINIDNKIQNEVNKLNQEIQKETAKYLPLHAKADDSRLLNGKSVTSDYSSNDDTAPASITALREVYLNTESRILKSNIVDDLTSGGSNKVLSAEQGKELKNLIENIKIALSTGNGDVSNLAQIIQMIKDNKGLIDSLNVNSIIGLNDALNEKISKTELTSQYLIDKINEDNTNLNADKLDGKDSSLFNQIIGVDYNYQSRNVGSDEPEIYPFVKHIETEDGVIKQITIQEYDLNNIKSDLNLSNVDNTSDLDKPVSTAVQNLINQTISNLESKFTDNTIINNLGKIGSFMTYKTITNIAELANLSPGIYKISSTNYSISGQTFTDDYIIKLSDTEKLHILVD